MNVATREDAINLTITFMEEIIFLANALARSAFASGRDEALIFYFYDIRDFTSYVAIVTICFGSVPIPYAMFRDNIFNRSVFNYDERLSIIEIMRRRRVIRSRIANSATYALEGFFLGAAV